MLKNSSLITFIFSRIPTSGGSGRSVLNYMDFLKQNDYPYRMIVQNEKRSFRKLLYSFLFTKNIVANGLTNFNSWKFVFAALFSKKLRIYLHEDETHLDAFCKAHPAKVMWLKKILQNNRVFFASEWQSRVYINRFQLKNADFWYENIIPPVQLKKSDKLIIGMVGYISKRKGYQLFSALAERPEAAAFEFYWLGNKAENINFKTLPPAVNWLGENQDVHGFLQQIDLLFFSAEFDCFPLAVAEAVANNKKILLYKENGWADKLNGVKGARVYHSYDTEAVLPLLQELLLEEVDQNAYKKIFEEYASTQSFVNKIGKEFNIPL